MNRPGHPARPVNFPRTPKKRLSIRCRTIFLCFLGVLLVAEVLSFTSFCYADKRFYDDDYFLSTAIDYETKLTRAHYPTAVQYESVSDFLSKNPDCCTVSRWKGRYREAEVWSKIFFFPRIFVYLKFRKYDLTEDWDYDAYYILDACGTNLDRSAGPRAAPN